MKTPTKSLRRQDSKLPADYDLCSSIGGEWIDIIFNYQKCWSLRYCGYVKKFQTRTEAIDWLEEHGVSDMKYEPREY